MKILIFSLLTLGLVGCAAPGKTSIKLNQHEYRQEYALNQAVNNFVSMLQRQLPDRSFSLSGDEAAAAYISGVLPASRLCRSHSCTDLKISLQRHEHELVLSAAWPGYQLQRVYSGSDGQPRSVFTCRKTGGYDAI